MALPIFFSTTSSSFSLSTPPPPPLQYPAHAFLSSSPRPSPASICHWCLSSPISTKRSLLPHRPLSFSISAPPRRFQHRHRHQFLCKAAEYVFPDPIPEFAESEIEKFRAHLLEKLSKKDIFGDSVKEVVGICTEIMSTFLHMEYGGPGTLLVVPFIDMADTINERGLPGGPQAARAAVVWAQKHVDNDWKEWTGGKKKG